MLQLICSFICGGIPKHLTCILQCSFILLERFVRNHPTHQSLEILWLMRQHETCLFYHFLEIRKLKVAASTVVPDCKCHGATGFRTQFESLAVNNKSLLEKSFFEECVAFLFLFFCTTKRSNAACLCFFCLWSHLCNKLLNLVVLR